MFIFAMCIFISGEVFSLSHNDIASQISMREVPIYPTHIYILLLSTLIAKTLGSTSMSYRRRSEGFFNMGRKHIW